MVENLVRKRGNIVTTITEEERARWVKATEPVLESWIKQVKERGIDGGKLVEAARALIAKHTKA